MFTTAIMGAIPGLDPNQFIPALGPYALLVVALIVFAETGLLISEVVPGSPALPSRFLTRNRIIAALSKATLVVEAAFRSGSLRTAHDAAELLRLVMAIPGPITSPTSEGCHRLIGGRVAELVTSISDAAELLAPLMEGRSE